MDFTAFERRTWIPVIQMEMVKLRLKLLWLFIMELICSLIVLLNRPFFHLSIADNVIAFRCSSVKYSHLLLSPFHFQSSLSTFAIKRVASLGFLLERFSKGIENNNHSRIIYGNDNIARLVKT